MRRTKRCDAVADAARAKAKALVAVHHTAMCVRFVVRLQARVRGRRARLLAPAKAPRERTDAAAHTGPVHHLDVAIASAEREARMASKAVHTKRRSLAKLLPAANVDGEASPLPPPQPPLLRCLARCLGTSAKARS